jgi:alpha-tubulin suppressor-like RCC1 family protein/plastocyanin
MALTFPGSPSVNQIYVDATSGNVYQWNGTVWINYNTQNPKNILELDDISGSFNGSTDTFALTSSGGPVTPVVASQIIVNIGGIAQNAGTDFTISGSNITFTTPPTGGLTFSGFIFGGSLNLSSFDDGSITPYSLTAGGPVWDSAGNITITGIATIGSSSVTIDGSTNRVTVGTGATISSDGITVGIVTAAEYYGDGSGLTGIVAGVGTTTSINTTGIITATSFHGDGSGITNIGGLLEPLVYNPGIGATGIAATTNIVLTYQKPIAAGVGIVTIQTAELTYNQTLTAADSSNYTVAGNDRDGSVSGTDPAITINVGDTIVFNNTVSGSHPLYIRVSDGGASVSEGTLTGEGTATTTWDTFGVTPGTYYYQCGVHAAMIGQIIVQDNVSERFDVSTVGSSSSISISNADLTINPATDLGIAGTSYYVVFPEGAIRDNMNTSTSVGISSYYFETAASVGLTSSVYNGPYELYIMGDSPTSDGALGLNDQVRRSSPTQIPGTNWTTIHSGPLNDYKNLSLKGDGTLWSWGYNQFGALGLNNAVNRSSPTQIPGTQWVGAVCGRFWSIATKTDGTLWGWGLNTFYSQAYGALGLNDLITRSSPHQIPGTSWDTDSLSIGRDNVYVKKTDGTLWSWGYNSLGQLTQNDTVPRSSPVQIPGTDWNTYGGGYNTLIATKTDGTLWAWGNNQYGDLGQNNKSNYSSPIQIPGTQWVAASSYAYGSIATKNDGTLWAWGSGANGRLGQNDTAQRSSPIQIPGTQWSKTDFRAVYDKCLIKKTDGTLWIWGSSTYGTLGLNDVANRSSPHQIPGTQWSLVQKGISTNSWNGTRVTSLFKPSS